MWASVVQCCEKYHLHVYKNVKASVVTENIIRPAYETDESTQTLTLVRNTLKFIVCKSVTLILSTPELLSIFSPTGRNCHSRLMWYYAKVLPLALGPLVCVNVRAWRKRVFWFNSCNDNSNRSSLTDLPKFITLIFDIQDEYINSSDIQRTEGLIRMI